jgi:Tol biopolymer transport system component
VVEGRVNRAALLLVASLSVAATGAQAPATRTAPQQFQEAVTLMESRGDYRRAIPLLEAVAAGSDRALAARALVYIGACYERLGRGEAERAYRRVIEAFPEQRAAVGEARARLAALARATAAPTAPPSPTLRKLWARRPANILDLGALAAATRALSYRDADGNLALADPLTGDTLRMVATPAGGTIWPGAVPSPDASLVAYAWEPADGPMELRLASRSDTAPRTLLRAAAPGDWIQPGEWPHPDHLLIRASAAGRDTWESVTPATGGRRALVPAPAGLGASLSPDGRFLAYETRGAGTGVDIHLADTVTLASVPLVVGPGRDWRPVWTRDGRSVLFVSDRTGTPGLWSIAVADGRPAAQAVLLQQDIGRVVTVIGVSGEGAFYYFRQVGLVDVQTVATDEAGTPTSPPASVTAPLVGSNMMPDWSPDGARLAYLARMEFEDDEVLAVREIASSKVTELRAGMAFLRQPRWSPDGRSLLVIGNGSAGYGFYRVDAAATDAPASPLLTVPPAAESTIGRGAWTIDGRALTFVRSTPGGSSRVVRRELDSGAERILYAPPAGTWLIGYASSPSDDALAVALGDEGGGSLRVVTADGASRELVRVTPREFVAEPAWRPDGASVLFVRGTTDPAVPRSERRNAIWQVPAAGGAPRPLGLALPGLRDLAVGPDGRQLAFTVGYPLREEWIVEHVVPAAPGALASRGVRRAQRPRR